MNETYSRDEIVKIARRQKTICWVFLTGISSLFLIPVLSYFAILVYFVAGFALIFYLYYLARDLKVGHPWLYVLGMFIPLVQWIVILSLISKATKVLRAHSVEVGVMGYKKESMAIFEISR